MLAAFSNSWRLFRSSLDVLSRDRELVIFPVLSGIASLLVLGSFVGGMYGTGLLEQIIETRRDANTTEVAVSNNEVLGWVVLFAWYFVNYAVVIYFNSALVGAAHIRLHGGDPTVADGLAAANRCLGSILGYAAIAATVGVILRAIESRSRGVGRFVAGLLGIAWSLVTYLIVPVLVIERRGPFAAVGRSASLFRQTWGEQIVANVGFGAVGFVLMLPGLALILLSVWLVAGAGQPVFWLIAGCGVALLYWVLLSIVLAALQGIYTAALYGYATDHRVLGFPEDLVAGAFSPRG